MLKRGGYKEVISRNETGPIEIEIKFRQPNRLSNPAQVLKLLVPAYQKVSGARAVSKHMKLSENESHSFAVFLTGLQKVIAD